MQNGYPTDSKGPRRLLVAGGGLSIWIWIVHRSPGGLRGLLILRIRRLARTRAFWFLLLVIGEQSRGIRQNFITFGETFDDLYVCFVESAGFDGSRLRIW